MYVYPQAHQYVIVHNYEGLCPDVPKIQANLLSINDSVYRYTLEWLPHPKSMLYKYDGIIECKRELTENDLEVLYNEMTFLDVPRLHIDPEEITFYKYEHKFEYIVGDKIYRANLVDFNMDNKRFVYNVSITHKSDPVISFDMSGHRLIVTDRLLFMNDLPVVIEDDEIEDDED